MPILIRGRHLCLKRYGYRRECHLLSACTRAETPVPCSPQRPLAWSVSQDRHARHRCDFVTQRCPRRMPLQWHSTWATARIYATQWLFYQHYRTILSENIFSSCRTRIPQDTMIQRESGLLNDSEGHGMPLAIFCVESAKPSACDGNIIGRHADPYRLGSGGHDHPRGRGPHRGAENVVRPQRVLPHYTMMGGTSANQISVGQ